MTELLNSDVLEWAITLMGQMVVAGLAVSCFATALAWMVTTVIKLLYKLF